MAELSFPFDADNANGGSRVVSQTQWQQMALAWTNDRIDFPLVNTSYDGNALPFTATTSGRDVTIGAGTAWVGGFYYKLTDTKRFTIADNLTTKGRRDLVVLRADMAAAAVNLAVVQGTPATSPTEPKPVRQIGAVWEMPLFAVEVPANNGAISINRRAPHVSPAILAFPWNMDSSMALLPRGSFGIDLDSNGGDTQNEAFNGRDGYVTTRHFGKSRTYTPSTLYVKSGIPAANRRGRWRWVSPNTFWFSVTIVNDFEDQAVPVTGDNWRAAVTLPMNSNPKAVQTCHGYLSNPRSTGNLPNMTAITATTHPGSNILFLHWPNTNSVSEGLDGMKAFPARSTFSISGTVEANEFSE
ncbi:hypothetical protein ABZ791_10810 [Streptomyces huasconensis]|uniref:Minor tail protein n=1 Tax=Streptomyces huasconensis TaxID=1854574 RepID=A0ABV3M7I9_9ACTN